MIWKKNKTNDLRQRNISIELLRIILTIMVVLLHITGHGVADAEIEKFSGSYWLAYFLNVFSIVAVNGFVLINGYFANSSEIKIKKLALLWIQVFMYSVGVYLLVCLLPGTEISFSIKELIMHTMPLLTSQYWFFTCYILLNIVAPFINRGVQGLSKQEYEKMLAVLLVIFCMIPSINVFGDRFGVQNGYSFIWFVVLYLAGGYLRRWPVKKRSYIKYYLGISVVLYAIMIFKDVINSGSGAVNVAFKLQFQYNSPLVFLASVCLFLGAVYGRSSYGSRLDGIICKVASLSFGVYLLHDHVEMRSALWSKWVRLAEIVDNGLGFLARASLALIIIFCVGIVVEWIRSKVVRGLMKKIFK